MRIATSFTAPLPQATVYDCLRLSGIHSQEKEGWRLVVATPFDRLVFRRAEGWLSLEFDIHLAPASGDTQVTAELRPLRFAVRLAFRIATRFVPIVRDQLPLGLGSLAGMLREELELCSGVSITPGPDEVRAAAAERRAAEKAATAERRAAEKAATAERRAAEKAAAAERRAAEPLGVWLWHEWWRLLGAGFVVAPVVAVAAAVSAIIIGDQDPLAWAALGAATAVVVGPLLVAWASIKASHLSGRTLALVGVAAAWAALWTALLLGAVELLEGRVTIGE